MEQNIWTVMIFMVGDNNLSIDMSYALDELHKNEMIKKSDKIKLFVYYDNNSPDTPPIYCNFSDQTKSQFVYSNELTNLYSSANSINFQNASGLTGLVDFVDWAYQSSKNSQNHFSNENNKNEKYVLIFSGHTMGFLSMGLLKEESKNTSMSMPALYKGLKLITNKIINKKLAILGFDSCVMSMLEVGHQFEEISETMIASEGSIPNAGWSYHEILSSIENKKFNGDERQIASDFVYKYINKQASFSIGGVSVDLSAWDLQKLGYLEKSFERFTRLLLKCFEVKESKMYKQIKRVILQVHFDCQTYLYDQNIDIGDFCTLFAAELESLSYENDGHPSPLYVELSESVREVRKAITDCILLGGFSGGTYQYSTGISLFFPWSLAAYQVSERDYEKLNFIKKSAAGTNWNTFLRKYLSDINMRRGINPTSFAQKQ